MDLASDARVFTQPRPRADIVVYDFACNRNAAGFNLENQTQRTLALVPPQTGVTSILWTRSSIRAISRRQATVDRSRTPAPHRSGASGVGTPAAAGKGAQSTHNAGQTEPASDSDMAKWSHWALAQADRVDPVSSRAFLQPVSEGEPEESDSVQTRHEHASTTTAHDATAPAWHPNRWYTRLHWQILQPN